MLKSKRKPYGLLILIILTIAIMSACTNKEKASAVEQYVLKEEEIKYKGYLSPINIKNYDIDKSKLIVNNGDPVTSGQPLTKIDEKIEAEINGLKNKQQQLEADKTQVDQKIAKIKKGNYSISPELAAEVDTLKESIQSQDNLIKELELNLDETKYSYESEKGNINRDITQNQTDLQFLTERRENLTASTENIELENEENATIDHDIKVLERENSDLNASLQALDQTYKYNDNRVKQSIQNAKDSKKTFEVKLQNIQSGNVKNSSVNAVILQLEEEKKLKQESIDEIKQTIATQQEEAIVTASFDGQIQISLTGQVVLLGTEYQFVFDASEKQVEEVKDLENLTLNYKSKSVGNLVFNSTKFNEEISVQGQTPYYSMVYDIVSDHDYKPMHKATAYMVYKKGIVIPEEYLGKTGNDYFVIMNGKKKPVKVEKLDKQTILVNGAKVGDKIERVANEQVDSIK